MTRHRSATAIQFARDGWVAVCCQGVRVTEPSSYSYDEVNNKFSETDLGSNDREYLHDLDRRVTKVAVKTNRDVNPDDPTQFDYSMAYTYANVSNVSRIVKVVTAAPNANVIEAHYDGALDRQTRVVLRPTAGDPDANSLIYGFGYTNVFGGATKTYSLPSSFSNPQGKVTNLYYDASARITQRAWPQISTGVSGTQNPAWKLLYDSTGQVTGYRNPKDPAGQMIYDADGRLRTRLQDPGGLAVKVESAYDPVGRITAGPRRRPAASPPSMTSAPLAGCGWPADIPAPQRAAQ